VTTFIKERMITPQHFDSDFSGEVDVHHMCGATYKGQIKEGKRDGQGTMIYGNGIIYCGAFTNNHIHGEGMLTFPNGDTYNGTFKNNVLLPDVVGTYNFSDGSRLIGMPCGVASQFLKRSMDSFLIWPPRMYCPISRHISSEQHRQIIEIADEECDEEFRIRCFSNAVKMNNLDKHSRHSLSEDKAESEKYMLLSQGWWDYDQE